MENSRRKRAKAEWKRNNRQSCNKSQRDWLKKNRAYNNMKCFLQRQGLKISEVPNDLKENLIKYYESMQKVRGVRKGGYYATSKCI